MFFAALFAIARTWKQPRCPSTDVWIKKQCYKYTAEYYTVTKRNVFESVVLRLMNLEPIIQKEVQQKDKNKYHILRHIYEIQNDGTDEHIFSVAMEIQAQRTDLWTQEGKERV